ncbi:MAG: DUF3179 domain-containing protein [Planctomycetaceae bacterium]
MSESSSNSVSAPTPRRRIYSRAGVASIALLVVLGVAGLTWTSELLTFVEWASREKPGPNYIDKNPQLSDDERLMYALSHVGGQPAIDSAKEIVRRDDPRFIPVLIEMLVANEAEISLAGAGTHNHIKSLEQLADRNFRNEAQAVQRMAEFWKKWYLSTDIEPPPGFVGWKGRLLSRYDPFFSRLLRNESEASVRVEEIHAAGARRVVGPALNKPKFISAAEATQFVSTEPVIGVRINGESRAYPQRIIDWHQAVNDVVSGIPVSITCCGLTGTAICFNRQGPKGQLLTLNSSGLVYRGNELLYDDETHSLWCQITGRQVVGEESDEAFELSSFPVVISSWGEWKEEHPDTRVLSTDTGFRRNYEPGAARGRYFEAPETVFPPYQPDDSLPAKTRVFGLFSADEKSTKAYPVSALVKTRVINDTVGETPYVLVSTNGELTVDWKRRNGVTRYPAGAEIRAYRREGETFQVSDDSETVLDSRGARWDITEEALVGPDNRKLARVPGVHAFWFGWHAFHPDGALYRMAAKSN